MNIDDSNDRARDEEYQEALDFFNVSKNTIDNASEVSFDTGRDNKLLEVQNIAREYKATLEGKSRADTSDSKKIVFKQTGKALASRNFIHISYSMLYSFADSSNIVGNKQFEHFMIQFKDAFKKVQNMALRDASIDDKEQSGIIKLFKDKLFNIGQIITNDSGNMKLLLEVQKNDIDREFAAFDNRRELRV